MYDHINSYMENAMNPRAGFNILRALIVAPTRSYRVDLQSQDPHSAACSDRDGGVLRTARWLSSNLRVQALRDRRTLFSTRSFMRLRTQSLCNSSFPASTPRAQCMQAHIDNRVFVLLAYVRKKYHRVGEDARRLGRAGE